MPKVVVSRQEFLDTLLWNSKEIGSEYWRHGRRVTFKVEKDGAPYIVTLDVHSDDGVQIYDDTVELTLAKPVIKTVHTWEPA